jgi:excinuclease UvrABC nuclease subunit
MPFEGYGGFSYTPVSVHKNAPALPGVYGLSNSRQWIFVGAAANIQSALMAHLMDRDSAIRALSPAGFTFEVCHPDVHAARVERLVKELSPPINLAANRKGAGR